MSRFQLNRVLFVLFGVAAVLVAVTVAQATPITFDGIYDGSYDPYTASPPAGQSTWRQGSATIDPVPNDDNGTPTAGVATFNDAVDGERLNMNRQYLDGNTFSANQANDEYAYEARIKLYDTGLVIKSGNTHTSIAMAGFRDEYNGASSGKTVMLAWACSTNTVSDSGGPGLFFINGAGRLTDNPIRLSSVDYFDNAFHTYRVEKYIDGEGITQVDVRVDNTLLGTNAYSSLFAATATGEGFGWYGSTPHKSEATVDYINYQGYEIPEPSALALLATGLIGLLCYAWRKRK